jgi:uncharacterized protein
MKTLVTTTLLIGLISSFYLIFQNDWSDIYQFVSEVEEEEVRRQEKKLVAPSPYETKFGVVEDKEQVDQSISLKQSALEKALDEGNFFELLKLENAEILKKLILKNDHILHEKGPQGQTLLMEAISSGASSMADLMIKKGADINALDSYGQSPLGLAVIMGDSGIFKNLMEKNAQITPLSHTQNYTMLMEAASSGHQSIVAGLIDAGIDIQEEDYNGESALFFAAKEGNLEIVKMLLEAGANKDLQNVNQKTPADFARKYNHPEIYSLLK